MKFLKILSFGLLASASMSVSALAQDSKIVGDWSWLINGKLQNNAVTISADGSCKNTGNSCTWRQEGSNYVLSWKVGGHVDTLALSADGQRLSGKNARNATIEGERRPSFIGDWVWSVNGKSVGDVMTMAADGSCKGPNGTGGQWRKSGSNYTITWNHGFVDTMTLSPDGKTISGKNAGGDVVVGTRR